MSLEKTKKFLFETEREEWFLPVTRKDLLTFYQEVSEALGGSGGNTWTVNETPSGSINGINTVYTTAGTFQSGKLCVYYNGNRQPPSYYTEAVGLNGFTLSFTPDTGDDLKVDYINT